MALSAPATPVLPSSLPSTTYNAESSVNTLSPNSGTAILRFLPVIRGLHRQQLFGEIRFSQARTRLTNLFCVSNYNRDHVSHQSATSPNMTQNLKHVKAQVTMSLELSIMGSALVLTLALQILEIVANRTTSTHVSKSLAYYVVITSYALSFAFSFYSVITSTILVISLAFIPLR